MAGRAGSARAAAAAFSRRRALLTVLLAFGGTAIGLTGAAAHSRLVRSDPSARAVLAAAPKEVKLWFNEQVEPAFAKIWLIPSEGEKIPLANRGDPTDKHLLIATLGDKLPDGPVLIGFRVLSVDGHVIEAQLAFSIKKPA